MLSRTSLLEGTELTVDLTAVVVLGGPDAALRIRAGCEAYGGLVSEGNHAIVVFSSKAGLRSESSASEKLRWITGDRIGPPVPVSDYIPEPRAGTTVENAIFCLPSVLAAAGLLDARGGCRETRRITRMIVITSDFHMQRPRALFELAKELSGDAHTLDFHAIANPPPERWDQLPHAASFRTGSSASDSCDLDGLAAELLYERQQLAKDCEALPIRLSKECKHCK